MVKSRIKIFLVPIYYICNQLLILLFEFLTGKHHSIYNKRAKELLCYLYSYFSQLLDRLNENLYGFSINKDKVKKILVIRLDKIGDMIWTTPVFTTLREEFPNAVISEVAGSWVKPIIESNPYIDNVIIYDIWSYAPPGKRCTPLKDRIKILRQLKKERFDLILNLRTSLGFLLFGLITNGVFIGKERAEHGVKSALSPLYKLGIKPSKEELSIFLNDDAIKFADEFLRNNNIINNDNLIGIHPGAGWVGRQWKPENFAVVADELANKYGSKIIIFGSSDDVISAQKIAENMQNKPIIAAGKTNLMQMSAILSRCNLFIGHDTGPMHIAVALKVPVVVLWGAAPIEHAYPWTKSNMYRVVKKYVNCYPCSEIECKNNYMCIQSICADDVLSSAYSLIKESCLLFQKA